MTETTPPSRIATETDRFRVCYEREKKIGRSLRVWSTLLDLLECPHPVVVKGSRSVLNRPPASHQSDDIRSSLVKLLFAVGLDPSLTADKCAILGGIAKAGCWKEFLATEDGTYLLASTLVQFLDTYSIRFDLSVAMTPAVGSILRQWLNLEDGLHLPSPELVCEKLFGVAWAQLALPDDCRALGGGHQLGQEDQRDIVSKMRPPFLPGLGVPQEDVAGLSLPNLGPGL